jgi:hypothetical protein
VRLLFAVIAGGIAAVLIQRGLVTGASVAGLLAVVVFGDNWSILHTFPAWLPPGKVTFADDVVTSAIKKGAMPFRVYDPSVPDPHEHPQRRMAAAAAYLAPESGA